MAGNMSAGNRRREELKGDNQHQQELKTDTSRTLNHLSVAALQQQILERLPPTQTRVHLTSSAAIPAARSTVWLCEDESAPPTSAQAARRR